MKWMQERRATEHNRMRCAAPRLRVRSLGRALNCVDACVQQVRIEKKGQPFKMAHLLSQKDVGKQSVRPVFFFHNWSSLLLLRAYDMQNTVYRFEVLIEYI